ncbi:alpha/beta fold hydrolase [Sphingobacterium thalpophilum]|uniref:alpha/beta fold hydrolase n=1 Tax=Sphingobacterium thalpophilum TaxID=259 RepID=UPI0024A68EE2|nr:alpha/beta hydrolase [Sphingobacterium thalpophilum]
MHALQPKMGYAPINGIKLYYEIYGNGRPLVLIHGGGSSGFSDFEETVRRLQDRYQLILPDMQNHGRSAHRRVPETFEQDVMDIISLLDHLSIGKASIFGFSNGATTALKLAALFPDKVDKLIAASGNTKRDGLIDGFFESMESSTIDAVPQFLKDNFLKLNPDPDKFKNMYEKDSQRMIHFQDFEQGVLAGIQCPVFLLGGDQDVVRTQHLASMHQEIPNCRLMILPANHGNYMMRDFFGNVDEVLIDFTLGQIKAFLDTE